MGMLSLRRGGDPLDPQDWTKSRKPVVKTDVEKGIFGPGHNCFVKSEDGLTDIMVFHARQYDKIQGDPLYDENRHTYTLPVEWDENEEPVFRFRKNRRPNILMMVVDHQAFYGHSRVQTPYFDRLVEEGVSFERSQGCTSRSAVQQEIICCSNRIKMVQKPRKIKVFRGFTVSKRADIV